MRSPLQVHRARWWRPLFAVAVLASCGPELSSTPSPEQLEAELEFRAAHVVPRDYRRTASEVRRLREGEYPSAVMDWVDLVWDDIYYEGTGLGNRGSKGVSCLEYTEYGVLPSSEPPESEDPLFRLPGDHCFGAEVTGPEFVWCLLDAQFGTESRIPDLRFEDWTAFMDFQCRLVGPAANEPVAD